MGEAVEKAKAAWVKAKEAVEEAQNNLVQKLKKIEDEKLEDEEQVKIEKIATAEAAVANSLEGKLAPLTKDIPNADDLLECLKQCGWNSDQFSSSSNFMKLLNDLLSKLKEDPEAALVKAKKAVEDAKAAWVKAKEA